MSRERRIITRAALRAEQYSNGGGRVLRGTAAAFNQPTRLADGWHEVIAPGAFTRSLQRQDDVRALVNHDPNLLLGRTKSGTLQLSESKAGLDFLVTLPDTSTGRDTWQLVKRGDWDMCSFAFQVDGPGGDDWQDDGWTCTDEECCRKSTPLRTLRNLRLFDISPVVTYPAYVKGTSVSGFAVEDLSRDPDEDEDDNGADGAGDPWTQYSVIVSAEARNRARRAHRHSAAAEAHDFASKLFRAQVAATKTLVGGQ